MYQRFERQPPILGTLGAHKTLFDFSVLEVYLFRLFACFVPTENLICLRRCYNNKRLKVTVHLKQQSYLFVNYFDNVVVKYKQYQFEAYKSILDKQTMIK